MSRASTLTVVATLLLATASGAMAATEKHSRVSEAAASSMASAASSASTAEPTYFQQAKGCID